MTDTITVMLCVNDERGYPQGAVTDIQVDPLEIELEGDPDDGDDFARESRDGRDGIGVGSMWFPILGYSTWVGNCMWDAAEMEPADVATLLNYLRTLLHWSMTAGPTELYDKWQRDESFAAADFAGEGA